MKSLLTNEQRRKEKEYISYKKLIRNFRRGKVEKINSKKADNNIPKE